MLRIGVIMYQTSLTKGQELVAQRMVRELRRRGHEAFLITSVYHDWSPVVDSAAVKGGDGYLLSFDEALGVPVVRVNSEIGTWPPRRVSFVNFMSVLPRLVDELQLNVLITHSTLWNGPEDAVRFVKWRRKLIDGGSLQSPVVLCHMSHLQEADEGRYAIYERAYREVWNSMVIPSLISESDLILVTTPYEAESMKKLGADFEQLLLFPGGIDGEGLSTADASALRATHRLPSDAKLVASLGTVEERKNALAILRVAAILSSRPDIHFAVAGRIEGDYGERVKKEAAKLHNVTVLGEVSEEEKASLIGASFANISMSRSEALGISQLEFMNAGVPVVTSGVGGQSWIVKDAYNGLVVNGPDDVEGAARAVVRLVDDSRLRSRLGENGKEFASEFLISVLVDRLTAKLGEKIQTVAPPVPGLLEKESVIDAWALKGQKVAATSLRLVIRSVRSGKDVVTIPYDEIAKVVRSSKAPWRLLGVGASLTILLLFSRLLHLELISNYLRPMVSSVSSAAGLGADAGILLVITQFLPLIISSLAFLVKISHGYQIQYGESKKFFLPRRFLKALKIADNLTPNELFVDDC